MVTAVRNVPVVSFVERSYVAVAVAHDVAVVVVPYCQLSSRYQSHRQTVQGHLAFDILLAKKGSNWIRRACNVQRKEETNM